MLKRILILALAFVLYLTGTVNALAEDDNAIDFEMNGMIVEIPARIWDGSLFLPLRAVSEELGYDVQWNGEKKEIQLNKNGKLISLNLFDYKINVNGHESYLTSGYKIVNGTTYLRQYFFSDNLGINTVWDKAGNTVTLQEAEENPIVISTKVEASETATLKLTIQYPELKGLDNAQVQDKLNSLFSRLATEAKSRAYEIEKYISEDQITRHIKAEGYFNYQVKYNQNGLISIVFYDYQYSGGAHGGTVQSSYTFDLKTGVEYELKDFFKDNSDYVSSISSEVKKQMKEREMTDLLVPFSSIRQDQDFYLSENAIVVYFQEYEYFPYAYGIPEFDVDFPLTKEKIVDLRTYGIQYNISENIVDTHEDSPYNKVVVKMTEGKYYEEENPGPFQGWNWQGKFAVRLMDEKDQVISELDLNKAFEADDLIFGSIFSIQFKDYNNDGNADFAIGQYGSSNGSVYRLFTIKDDKIEALPVKTGEIFSSEGNGWYTAVFEKLEEGGFFNSYYDNAKGQVIKQRFLWDGSQFVLEGSEEK